MALGYDGRYADVDAFDGAETYEDIRGNEQFGHEMADAHQQAARQGNRNEKRPLTALKAARRRTESLRAA